MITHQDTCQVHANKKISPRLYQLSLDAPALAHGALPGQFIHLRVTDGLKPFFRRPFSIFRRQKTVDILYDVVGPGTALLSKKKKGDRLDCLGPLGTPFALPPKNIRQVVMVAGGVGVAPFLFLSDRLKAKGLKIVLLYGGRSKDQIFAMTEFKKNGVDVRVATDDGSVGKKGRVSVLFPRIDLKAPTCLYACGPRPMIACVQDFARRHHLSGQASLEEVMACGVGACLGCSVKTRHGFRTVCHDGPVFDLEDLIF